MDSLSVDATAPTAGAAEPIAIVGRRAAMSSSSNRIEICIPLAPGRSATVIVSGMGAIALVVGAGALFLFSDWFTRLW